MRLTRFQKFVLIGFLFSIALLELGDVGGNLYQLFGATAANETAGVIVGLKPGDVPHNLVVIFLAFVIAASSLIAAKDIFREKFPFKSWQVLAISSAGYALFLLGLFLYGSYEKRVLGVAAVFYSLLALASLGIARLLKIKAEGKEQTGL
ncbi:MAG: hypothetical protein A3H69_04190 [Candidatus Sungbacteria bacterium RIFCSPLOWO2_02_FULL_47_9]|uniref:Uncharacterized protein n=2 Tax=Parcubacteria group TaxID=1794811 RepID=A0A1G2RPS4_9BACT|nr:MAG: hypothetical protein UX72_C0003G0078 [Parcubacteria group bacterium GW2011_GWA2_47_10]OGZ94010.1 MAG: hypothetical protein A2633_01040 [Candidatus Sungbacteria bacterium RIFCSPHIGHO2_01_FULL_47_32]OHA11018.1 MAG: hypothetical protein A3H69_04190 [Candidatus Sungbacteria bacterium RIFCSPLOWO2_02_FULL_47_9]OHA74875.1 MAG: hypothetical protein A3A32_03435 [Candidatus Wildermuthbacteria bacterium RIFCSPLOWO2_01_FULL_48_35]